MDLVRDRSGGAHVGDVVGSARRHRSARSTQGGYRFRRRLTGALSPSGRGRLGLAVPPARDRRQTSGHHLGCPGPSCGCGPCPVARRAGGLPRRVPRALAPSAPFEDPDHWVARRLSAARAGGGCLPTPSCRRHPPRPAAGSSSFMATSDPPTSCGTTSASLPPNRASRGAAPPVSPPVGWPACRAR